MGISTLFIANSWYVLRFIFTVWKTRIANREQSVLYISLDDVAEHSSDLANAIECNAVRYTKIFAEVIDDLLPDFRTVDVCYENSIWLLRYSLFLKMSWTYLLTTESEWNSESELRMRRQPHVLCPAILNPWIWRKFGPGSHLSFYDVCKLNQMWITFQWGLLLRQVRYEAIVCSECVGFQHWASYSGSWSRYTRNRSQTSHNNGNIHLWSLWCWDISGKMLRKFPTLHGFLLLLVF